MKRLFTSMIVTALCTGVASAVTDSESIRPGISKYSQRIIPPLVKESNQFAATCFKTGERRSGMNKICYYNCLGSEYAITIGAVQLCPLTINN